MTAGARIEPVKTGALRGGSGPEAAEGATGCGQSGRRDSNPLSAAAFGPHHARAGWRAGRGAESGIAARIECYGDLMRARWATGFIGGLLAVIALVAVPLSALFLSVVVALLLVFVKARGVLALAGVLCGVGASGIGLVIQANANCETSYAGCQAEKVTDPVAIFAALLIAGAAVTLAHYVQGRRGRATV
jgi:hypothetical protein